MAVILPVDHLWQTQHAREASHARGITPAMIDQVVGMPEETWQQENGRWVFVGIAANHKITVIRDPDGMIVTAFPGHAQRSQKYVEIPVL